MKIFQQILQRDEPEERPPLDPWRIIFVIIAFVMAVILVLLISLSLARAKPPLGPLAHPEWHDWFEKQWSIGHKQWCCNVSDGHLLDDDEWRANGNHFEVLIEGKWYQIPDSAMRDPKGGPNPTGQAIVWYNMMGVYSGSPIPLIYCFAPGTQY